MSISIQPIIEIMEKLTEAHKQLLDLSQQKLTYIKNNDMDELGKILSTERKHIQTTENLEVKRKKLVEDFISSHKMNVSEKTISELLTYLPHNEDKVSLEKEIVKLIEVIVQLRESEQLNEELLQQSIGFVQTSLDLFDPTSKNFNYNDRLTESSTKKRSIFDSKA